MNGFMSAATALAFFGILIANADAASVTINGAEVVVSGSLQSSDLVKIPEGGITTLVFEESPGGSVAAAFKYVEIIQRRKLHTKVRGKCFSACAVAFLAGTTRTIDRAAKSLILFHLSSKNVDETRIRGTQDGAILDLLENLTGGRLSGEAMELIKKSWKDNQGLVFYFGHGLFGDVDLTFYCDGTQDTDLSRCTILREMNAKDLGVIS